MSSASSRKAAALDIAAGTTAGVAQIIVGHPFDVVKLNLQISNNFKGPLDAASTILTTQGLKGMYRGVSPPMATVAAFNALLFGVTGTLNRWVRPDGGLLTPLEAAFTGGLAGVPVAILATPTELLKCRLQAQGGARPPQGAVYSLADAQTGKVLYSGALDSAKRIVQFEGGALALFRGFLPTLLREVPGNAFYFGCYSWCKHQLAAAQGIEVSELGTGSLALSGALAGPAFWAPMLPVDVIKSKVQTDNPLNPQHRGGLAWGRAILKTEGVKGLFRGWQPCLGRSVPANAVTFLVYEQALLFMQRLTPPGEA